MVRSIDIYSIFIIRFIRDMRGGDTIYGRERS